MYSRYAKDLGCLTAALIIGSTLFADAWEGEIAYEGSPQRQWYEESSASQQMENFLVADNKRDRAMPSERRDTTNPTARGCQEENGPYITADFLYWKAVESDVDLVVNLPEALSTNSLANKTTIEKLHFKYDPGFQLGLGYNLNYDNWDVYTNWTSIRNHNTTSESASSPTFLVAPFTIAGSNPPPFASNYSMHWKLEYNTFDVEIGRDFFVSRHLSLRPLGSLRAAWLERTIDCHFDGMNSNYFNILRPGLKTLANGPMDLHFHNGFRGVGPRLGINSRWLLGNLGFGVLANISGSFLAGAFTNKISVTIHDTVESKGSVVKPKVYTTRVNADAALGLDYGYCMDGWFYIYTSASYNVTYWWNALGTVGYANTFNSQSHDVSLRGFNLQLRLDF